MKFIKAFIFGVRREPVDVMSTGFRTSHYNTPISFEEWCKEFNVSMLHDKKIVHFN
jgi:hypothetical protein